MQPVYQQQPIQPYYQQPSQPTYQPAPVFQPAVQVVQVSAVPTNASVQFSSKCGPSHGDTAQFNDRDFLGANLSFAQIVEVRVWALDFVYGIQTIWSVNGSRVESPRYVRSNHQFAPQSLFIDVAGGEYITGIEGSWGSWTDNITIVTTRQRVRFGGSNGGNPQIVQLPFGSKVLGFIGGFGNQLHNLGAVYTTVSQNLPTAGAFYGAPAQPRIPLF